MKIAQIILADAAQFERKCQRLDFVTLSVIHDVVVSESIEAARGADVAQIYGPTPLPNQPLIGLATPYIASSAPSSRRFALRRAAPPALIVSPLAQVPAPLVHLPEAVGDGYFGSGEWDANESGPRVIGSFRRPALMNIVEQTLARIGRFRDDVTWAVFDRPPSPADLATVDAWVDPALDERDFDGCVAEALVAGKPVVASRTAINSQRLEKGRAGFLVPPSDPNELTHAILTALFKPEVARSKIEAAQQTAGRFRPRQRSRVLERIYETLKR